MIIIGRRAPFNAPAKFHAFFKMRLKLCKRLVWAFTKTWPNGLFSMAFGQLQDYLGNLNLPRPKIYSAEKRKVLICPWIRFVDPQSVDQQGSDICGKHLSTFNDVIFNLLLVSLSKVPIEEPSSKSLRNTTSVDYRQYRKPYNHKKSKAINFGKERRHREG